MAKKKIAIFISGGGSNMQAIVKNCQDGILKDVAEVSLVFANKETAGGLEHARALGVETQWINSKGFKRTTFDYKVMDLLKSYEFDYIILAGYMRILSKDFVQAYAGKIINIHPADTTQHQGADGYEWAFETGLEQTQITVHYVDEGLDTGSIIEQAEVDLKGTTTLQEVKKRGLAVEHKFYSKVILKLILQD